MNDDNSDVLTLSLSDRLGDSGIVGTCILRYEHFDAVIDTFLLSCRALGREVEKVLLYRTLKRAKQRGAKQVVGHYIKTPKNAQVELYYLQQGFSENISAPGIDRTFIFEMTQTIPEDPDFFKRINFIE